MTQPATLEERRRRWAESATDGSLDIIADQPYPRMITQSHLTHSFMGAGIETMLQETGEAWNGAEPVDESVTAYTIDETSERLCDHFGLTLETVDELFGEHDRQTAGPHELAKRLLAAPYVAACRTATEPADPEGAKTSPRATDLAGYAYYDHTGRLSAIAVQHPTEHRQFEAYDIRTTEWIFVQRESLHDRMFSQCDREGDEDSPPLTVKPIFWSQAMRISIAETISDWARGTEDDWNGAPVAQLLRGAVRQALVGDHGNEPHSPFQPAAFLREA